MARLAKPKKSEPTKKIGRPKGTYVYDIVTKKADVLEWIAAGKSLSSFSAIDGNPDRHTVYLWANNDEIFADRLAHARELGQEELCEQTLTIIDEQPEFIIAESGKRRDPAYVAWQKARVDQRMKLLACWNPAKFGSKVDVTSNGKAAFNIVIDTGEKK